MNQSLYNEFTIPGAVSIVPGVNEMPKVVLTHRSASQAEVYLHGAHITSWKNARGDELFFVSRESFFETERPIRGGIPVVFPQFGKQGPLPQHGFPRTSEWRLIETKQMDTGTVFAQLQLTDSDETLSLWPYRFVLRLGLHLDEDTLAIDMQVVNTGNSEFDFQTALHTYFGIADIDRIAVRGLEGITFIDSLRDGMREVETRSEIRFAGETDRIYIDTPDCLSLDDEGNGRTITIEKKSMPDVVVWNPWIEKSKSMADFGDDEYRRMVCIETGSINTRPKLQPGERWCAETIFRYSSY